MTAHLGTRASPDLLKASHVTQTCVEHVKTVQKSRLQYSTMIQLKIKHSLKMRIQSSWTVMQTIRLILIILPTALILGTAFIYINLKRISPNFTPKRLSAGSILTEKNVVNTAYIVSHVKSEHRNAESECVKTRCIAAGRNFISTFS